MSSASNRASQRRRERKTSQSDRVSFSPRRRIGRADPSSVLSPGCAGSFHTGEQFATSVGTFSRARARAYVSQNSTRFEPRGIWSDGTSNECASARVGCAIETDRGCISAIEPRVRIPCMYSPPGESIEGSRLNFNGVRFVKSRDLD